MRIAKTFRKDQEIILRFLDVFGGGSAALGSSNKHAQAGFFVMAGPFIQEYIEDGYFKKVDLLLKALEGSGFPADEGPIGALRSAEAKCRDTSVHLLAAAKAWQSGDEQARIEVGWEASEFSTSMRHHLERLKNLVFPLLDQNLTPEDEHSIAEGVNKILFENAGKGDEAKYIKTIEALEEELSEWK